MSFALLSKQAGPRPHQTPPPFVGCLSVICLSALQANICSVDSDTTSLLFAQVLTSVPWTLCLLHPHPGVTKLEGHSFMCTAVLCVLFPWNWQTCRSEMSGCQTHLQSLKSMSLLGGVLAMPTGKHQEMKREQIPRLLFVSLCEC